MVDAAVYGRAPARWHSSRWLAADVAAAISSAVVIGRAFPELLSGGIDSVPTDTDAALGVDVTDFVHPDSFIPLNGPSYGWMLADHAVMNEHPAGNLYSRPGRPEVNADSAT